VSLLLLTLTGLFLLSPILSGCAKHADFVQVRQDVRALARSRDQISKQQRAHQRRLEELEADLTAKAKRLKGRGTETEMAVLQLHIDDLTSRLGTLERRIARVEVSQAAGSQDLDDSREEPALDVEPEQLPVQSGVHSPLAEAPGLSPTSAYNLAYADYLAGRFELSVAGFQRFSEDFPSTSLAPHASYWMGESYYDMKDFVRAIQAFEQVIQNYPESDKVRPALYRLGLSAAETGDAQRARAYLKRVIQQYKDSEEARLAKEKLADIR
ncbi:MAG: tol-pal system protein YbgF, partial [Nitrospirales bacterium]